MNKLSIISLIFLSGCTTLTSPEFNYFNSNECRDLFDNYEEVDIFSNFHNEKIRKVIISAFKKNYDLISSRESIYRSNLDRDYILNEQETSISSSLGYTFSHSFDGNDNQDGYSISLNLSSDIDIKGKKQLEKLIADMNVGISHTDHQLLESSLMLTIVDYIYTLEKMKFDLDVYRKIFTLEREKEWFQKVRYDLGYETLIGLEETLVTNHDLEEKIKVIEIEIKKLASDLSLLLGENYKYYNEVDFVFSSRTEQLYEKLFDHDVDRMEFFHLSENDLNESMVFNRSDIIKSSFVMCQALASYNISLLEMRPEITFGTTLNSSESNISKIFESPLFGFSVGISLPFLDWDRISINNKISKSNYESLIYEHKYNIYKSLADIETKEIARNSLIRNMILIDKKVSMKYLQLENAQVELSVGDISKAEYSERIIELYYMYIESYKNKKDLLISEFEFRTALGQRVVL